MVLMQQAHTIVSIPYRFNETSFPIYPVFCCDQVSIPYRFNETGIIQDLTGKDYLVSIPYRFNETLNAILLQGHFFSFNSL